ncbi:hypothetical protein LINPERPRIM_LOCUS3859 [Linum perenne]
MREKSRERGKGDLRGFGHGDFFSGFRSRGQDRVLRVVESRGRKITVSSSDRFADAAFKISVSTAGGEHYIFLDRMLLRWLGEVLQKALDRGWNLGRGLVKRSGSRSILVGSFTSKDVCFLRILEVCGNGRRFFVAIPPDEGKMGWGSCLQMFQSLGIRGAERIPASIEDGRSFAAVVNRGRGTSRDPGEPVRAAGGSTVVTVDEKEAENRAKRLKSWVVVNFILDDRGFVEWTEFRKWMARWWGIGVNEEAKLLGDDSWLVDCRTEETAEKVVSRGDWFFRGAKVEVRKWFPAAGRLDLLQSQGVRWILIFGIPVHVRSDSVFRDIGDACGGFVAGQDSGFSAVRLKVRAGSPVPDSLSIKMKELTFEIKVMVEPVIRVPVDKGKMVMVSTEPPLPPVRRGVTAPRSSSLGEVDARAGERVAQQAPGPRRKPIKEVSGEGKVIGAVGSGPIWESMEMAFSRVIAERPLGELGFGPQMKFLGLNDVGLESMDPCFFDRNQAFAPTISAEEGRRSGVSALRLEDEGVFQGEGILPARLFEGEDSDFASVSLVVEKESYGGRKEGESSLIKEHEDQGLEEDWEAITRKGQNLASLFGLSVEDSAEKAVKKVEETTLEVLRRRSSGVTKSKQDSELRRLKWNLSEAEPSDAARRPRYASIVPIDEP